MNASEGVKNHMGFQKAWDSRERERDEDREEHSGVNDAKGLRFLSLVACEGGMISAGYFCETKHSQGSQWF